MSTINRIIQTLRRKLGKSIEQYGLWKTALRCILVPLRSLWRSVYLLSPSRQAHLRAERKFDSQFGVDTREDYDLGWMADITSDNWTHGAGYEPAPIKSVVATIDELNVDFADYTFIDFGSGKGRSLFLASQFSFKKIIGVEYSPRWHTIAEENIAKYHNPKQQCSDIEAVFGDAASFPIPAGPLVLFFNHPFDEPVFEPVIQSIEQSFADSPRNMIVVYYDPQCAYLFDRSSIFSKRAAHKSQYVVYESKASLMADSQDLRAHSGR